MADQLTVTSYIIIAVFYIILMVISIPTNLLIIIATIIDKKLRSPTNMLVCNLSFASLVIAILRIPVKLYELFNPDNVFLFPNSPGMCVFQQILPASCVLCISITLTTICIDRFLAIKYPMKQHLKMTHVRLYIFLPSSWILSFASFITYGTYVKLFNFGNRSICVPVYPDSPSDVFIEESFGNITSIRRIRAAKIALWGLFIPFAFLIPCIIMCALYIHLVRHLWSGTGPSDKTHTISRRDEVKRLKQKRRVVKILIACCSVFLITNLPYYILVMLLDLRFVIVPNVQIVANTLIMINLSAIAYNPIIYGYFNKSFRYRVEDMLRRAIGLSPRRHRSFTISTTTATSQAPPGNSSQRYSPRASSIGTPRDLKPAIKDQVKSSDMSSIESKLLEKNTRASIETTLSDSIYYYPSEPGRFSRYSTDV